MSINDFFHKYSLKNKATSNLKDYQILSSSFFGYAGIYLRDGLFSTNIGIVHWHPTKRTHWVAYINENYLDSYGCSPPEKLTRFVIKRNGHCLYSEYKIQGQDSFCAAYCIHIINLTKSL